MREEEAFWLNQALARYSPRELSPCINIGSSTEEFRERVKPHIARYVTNPLLERKIELVNFDLKKGNGIDVVGDLLDNRVFLQLKEIHPRSLICSNVLEHVKHRELFAKRCTGLLQDSGLLFVTVPYSYPYHPDPLDTLYRPSAERLASLFPEVTVEVGEVIIDSRYIDDLKKYDNIHVLMRIARLFLPIYRPKSWISHMHRLLWLFRPYKISCVVLRKTEAR